MAEITAQMVKELRAKTDAGMMDCKKALMECDGHGRNRTFLPEKPTGRKIHASSAGCWLQKC